MTAEPLVVVLAVLLARVFARWFEQLAGFVRTNQPDVGVGLPVEFVVNHAHPCRAVDERFGVEFVLLSLGEIAAEPLAQERAESRFFVQRRREAAAEEQVGLAILSKFGGLEDRSECLFFTEGGLSLLERSHVHADGLAVILGVWFKWGAWSSGR